MAKYVRELSLTNVRQFQQRTFSLQPGFNLLVGENGAGKTTLLRSLLAVLATSKQKGMRASLDEQDIRLHSSELRITAQVATMDGEQSEESIYEHRIGARAKRKQRATIPMVLWYGSNEATCSSFATRKIKRFSAYKKSDMMEEERWLYRMHSRFYREMKSESNFGHSEEIEIFVGRVLNSFSSRFREFHWSFQPYDCSIQVSSKSELRIPFPSKTKRALESAILRRMQETERNRKRPWPDRESVTIDAKGSIVGAKEDRDELQWVDLDFGHLLHELKVDSKTMSLLNDCTIKVRLTPRIRILDRSRGGFLLNQLSDGEQRLFSLFVDIARQLFLQESEYGHFRTGSAVILIDEIDVHLHPKWQRMIVPALEDLFPACQFIATTHSPFVVQSVRETNVQNLNREISGEFTDRGIEEIAMKVMDIQDPLVSPRYLQMLDNAREYFRLLEEARGIKSNPSTSAKELKELKQRLDELSQKYAQNPAYQAYLELHGNLTFGPDELR